MNNANIYTELKTISERLTAHTTILNEVIKPDIEEIKDRIGIQNGRIGRAEKRIDARDLVCDKIQAYKQKNSSNWKWGIGILLTSIGLIIAGYKIFPQKIYKEVIIMEKVNDTLLRVAPINMRGNDGYSIDTINAVYFDIKNLKEF